MPGGGRKKKGGKKERALVRSIRVYRVGEFSFLRLKKFSLLISNDNWRKSDSLLANKMHRKEFYFVNRGQFQFTFENNIRMFERNTTAFFFYRLIFSLTNYPLAMRDTLYIDVRERRCLKAATKQTIAAQNIVEDFTKLEIASKTWEQAYCFCFDPRLVERWMIGLELYTVRAGMSPRDRVVAGCSYSGAGLRAKRMDNYTWRVVVAREFSLALFLSFSRLLASHCWPHCFTIYLCNFSIPSCLLSVFNSFLSFLDLVRTHVQWTHE